MICFLLPSSCAADSYFCFTYNFQMNKHWKNIQASVNSKFANPLLLSQIKVFLSRVALSLAEMFAPSGYTIRLFSKLWFQFQNA